MPKPQKMTAIVRKGGKEISEVSMNLPPGLFQNAPQGNPDTEFYAENLAAHDELVLIVRNAVDGFKCARASRALIQVLNEIRQAQGASGPIYGMPYSV